MTLIIYTRCSNASVVVSDKKESNPSASYGQPSRKYYLSRSCDYILAFAGEGLRAEWIFNSLDNDDTVTASNIKQKTNDAIYAYLGNYRFSTSLPQVKARGILLVREGGSFQLYGLRVLDGNAIYSPQDTDALMVGTQAAEILAGYLISKIGIRNLPWEIACKYLVAVMRDVSDKVNTVGRLDQYGFDITVLADSGQIWQCQRYMNTDSETILLEFTPDPTKDIRTSFREITGGGNL